MLLTNMGETIATIEVAIVLIKHGLLMSFFTLIGAGLLRHLSFGWQQCVGSRWISQQSTLLGVYPRVA